MFTHKLLRQESKNGTPGEVRMITWDFLDESPSLADFNTLAESCFPGEPLDQLEICSAGGEMYSIGFMRRKGEEYTPFEGDLPMSDADKNTT